MSSNTIHGHLLVATGVAHTLIAVIVKRIRTPLIDAWNDGFVNAFMKGDFEKNPSRLFSMYFTLFGFLIMMYGRELVHYSKKMQAPPRAEVGWSLLLFSIVIAAMTPASGAWLVIIQAIWIIIRAQNTPEKSEESSEGSSPSIPFSIHGYLLIPVGILHTYFALVKQPLIRTPLIEAWSAGFINAFSGNVSRVFAMYFTLFGILLIMCGRIIARTSAVTRSPPRAETGWSLLLFSIVGAAMTPKGGFWLLIPQAIIMIVRSWLNPTRPAVPTKEE